MTCTLEVTSVKYHTTFLCSRLWWLFWGEIVSLALCLYPILVIIVLASPISFKPYRHLPQNIEVIPVHDGRLILITLPLVKCVCIVQALESRLASCRTHITAKDNRGPRSTSPVDAPRYSPLNYYCRSNVLNNNYDWHNYHINHTYTGWSACTCNEPMVNHKLQLTLLKSQYNHRNNNYSLCIKFISMLIIIMCIIITIPCLNNVHCVSLYTRMIVLWLYTSIVVNVDCTICLSTTLHVVLTY